MPSRKDIAVAFERLVITGHVREAYERYVSADFRHHNPYFKGDRESLLLGMESNAAQFPDKDYEVQRVLGDGDVVAVHARLRLRPDMPDMSVVHIYRFDGDHIVEEWDCAQAAPDEPANENGFF